MSVLRHLSSRSGPTSTTGLSQQAYRACGLARPALFRYLATTAENPISAEIDGLPGFSAEETMQKYLGPDPLNYHIGAGRAWTDLGEPALFTMPNFARPGHRILHIGTETELVKHVFTDRNYNYRPPVTFFEYCYSVITDGKGKYGIVNRNGPDWEKHRSLANKALMHPSATKTFVTGMDRHAKTLLDAIAEASAHGPVDVAPILNHYTFSVVMQAAFGEVATFNEAGGNRNATLSAEESTRLFEAIKNFFMLARIYQFQPGPYDDSRPEFQTLRNSLQNIKEFGHRILNDRRDNPSENRGDFASNIFTMTSETGEMEDPAQVLTDSLDVMIGGTDTTAAGLSFAIHKLGLHPEVLARAQDEVDGLYKQKAEAGEEPILNDVDLNKKIPYVHNVIKEILRLHPPAPLNGRDTGAATILGNVTIPAQTTIVVPTYDIHRSEKYYDNPHDFNPSRWETKKHDPFAWLPFGLGARGCLGQKLSIMESKVCLTRLIRDYEWTSVHKEELPTATGITMGPAIPVEIQFTKRR